MSNVSELANKMTGLQQAAHAEGKEINEEYKRDQKLQSEWFQSGNAAEANKLEEANLDLQDKMENQKLEVEKMRADARQLEGEAKEKELDSFVGTQLERELETGADEPIKA